MKERPTIQQEQPGFTFGDIARELGRRWKTLDESARKPYTAQAEQDDLRHANEMTSYTAKLLHTPLNSGFVLSQSSQPTGWGLNQTHMQPTQQKKPRAADVEHHFHTIVPDFQRTCHLPANLPDCSSATQPNLLDFNIPVDIAAFLTTKADPCISERPEEMQDTRASANGLGGLSKHLFTAVMQLCGFEKRAIVSRASRAFYYKMAADLNVLNVMKFAPELFSTDEVYLGSQEDSCQQPSWNGCSTLVDWPVTQLCSSWQRLYFTLTDNELPSPQPVLPFARHSEYSLGVGITADVGGQSHKLLTKMVDFEPRNSQSLIHTEVNQAVKQILLDEEEMFGFMRLSVFVLRRSDQKIFLIATELQSERELADNKKVLVDHELKDSCSWGSVSIFNVSTTLGRHFYCDLEIAVEYSEILPGDQSTFLKYELYEL